MRGRGRRARWQRSLGLFWTLSLFASIGCEDAVDPESPPPDSPALESAAASPPVAGFSAAQIGILRSLSLSSLPAPPPVPSNPVADSEQARALGHALFFEPRLSRDAAFRCADCHQPAQGYSDGLARSVGHGEGARNAPTLIGVAHATWFFWDGRRDSLWSQALAPIEAPVEMGLSRVEAVRLVTADPAYAEAYASLFDDEADRKVIARLPERAGPYAEKAARNAWFKLGAEEQAAVNRIFANLGRVLAAYQRALEPAPGRFDAFVERVVAGDEARALALLDAEERAGLALFVDAERSQCLRCHNGPLLTNQSFHDVGTSRGGPVPDLGRFLGAQSLLLDEFNCLGPYSGVDEKECSALRFLNRAAIGESAGAFKTPTLRSLTTTGPYFHDGSRGSLAEVIEHYRHPPEGLQHELTPMEISDPEARQLVAFLGTLGEGSAADGRWQRAPGRSPASR